jgi:hypothetical protein
MRGHDGYGGGKASLTKKKNCTGNEGGKKNDVRKAKNAL